MSIENKVKQLAEPVRLGGLFACYTNGLVYLNIPKSACTTTRNIMYFLDHGEFLDEPLTIHTNKTSLLRADVDRERMLRTLVGRHLVFTFIREPDKRVYSCFVDKIHNIDKYSFTELRKSLIKNYDLKFEGNPRDNIDGHRQNFIKFLRFVRDNLNGKTDVRKDHHWQLQSEIIRHATKDVSLDFIGLVEKFAMHFHIAMQRARITTALGTIPRFNESAAIDVSLNDIITPEMKVLLNSIYERDYALYERVRARTAKLG